MRTPASSKITGRIGASRRQSSELLVCWARGTRRVSSVAAQLGSAPARRSSAGTPTLGVPSVGGDLAQRLGAEQFERAGQRRRGTPLVERDPRARALEQALATLDLRAQLVLALARLLELLLGDALALRVEVGVLDRRRRARSASRWRMPARSRRSMLVVDHLREAAELLLDGLGLPDEHVEHAVLDALGEHEVVAADLVGRLQLAVDAAVALLDPARVPRQVEVEQVGAVRLEVQTLAGGVGRDQDPQRIACRDRR